MTVRPFVGSSKRMPALAMMLSITLGASACSDDGGEPADPVDAPSGPAEGEAPAEVEEDGLPADFPRADLPLVDGDIVSVREPNDDDDAFTVLVSVDGTPLEAVSEAVDQLESVGWEAVTDLTGEPPIPQVLTKSDGEARRVIVTNTPQQDVTSLTYSISVSD